jgi:sugar lactone lactonase YvrE
MLGSSDGPATTTARFTVPNAVGVDRNGDIYITEFNKHAIRVLSNGNVSSFSGATIPGWVDGPTAAARFNAPTNIATDSFGALFVADTKNHAIRKIDPQRIVSTLAGKPAAAIDGSGGSAGFIGPASLARDAAGNLYVADAGSNSIRKVTGRMVTTIAAPAAVFSPAGVTVDGAGNVFFVEYGQRVWKVSPAGTATIYAGTGTRGGDDGPALSATFNLPQAIVVDTAGNLFVAELGNSSIRKISPSGQVTTFVGQNGSPGDADGQGSAARLNFPTSLAIDNNGNLYVADSANGKIRKITPSAVVTTVATLVQPTGVAIDASGVLWTTDSQHTVRRIRQDGTSEIVGGSPGKAGKDDGVGQAARFNGLAGIVVIADQTVVVSDGLNNTLRLGIPKTARHRSVHR